MFRDKYYHEIAGVFLILISLLLMISLFSHDQGDIRLLAGNASVNNLIGPFGALISHYLTAAFGLSSFLLSILFANIGLLVIKKEWRDVILERACSYFILLVTTSSLFSLIISVPEYQGGGAVGRTISVFLVHSIGRMGTWIAVILLNVIAFIFSGIMTLAQLRHIDVTNRISACREHLAKIAGRLRGRDRFPTVTVDTGSEGKGRMPWITKKRIMVYETEMGDSALQPVTPLKHARPQSTMYIEMKEPAGIDGPPVAVIDAAGVPATDFNNAFPIGGIDISHEMEQEIVPAMEPELPENGFVEDEEAVRCGEEYCEEDFSVADDVKVDFQGEPAETVTLKETRQTDFRRTVPVAEYDTISINKEYIIPTDFLTSSIPIDNESWQTEVRKNSLLLINTLAEFGVESRVVNVNRGPVITLYEMQIAPGIKVNKIVGLADDIAMALAASRVRVVAPIPGKSAIGVEIPNREREMVTLGDIIKSNDYQKHHGTLKVGLGKDILGKPVIIDLKKLPHLLIAGATGSGKSVCVNSIITSLIYNYEPNYVRFILIDPKMVELQLYDGGPHLLAPVITDPLNTPQVLRWAIYEMERRYRLLSELNTRDIERYNQKVSEDRLGLEKLPFIVIIIDELADLMMVASKEIEGYITRIAQKARAVGIHLVFATQRPSVDIITGIIKANIPARIAFQVAQKTDSRTIIDQNGAEKLLGKGDMLYQSPMSSFPTRIQGALITEEEILGIATFVKKYGDPTYVDIEEHLFKEDESDGADSADDELFVEALKIVEETKKASASYLQRRLSIGYNRAARIIEQMEDLGYVGPQQGSKARDVYI